MTLYCSTAEFPAVCAGTAKMKKIRSESLELALKLEPKIEAAVDYAEITIIVQHNLITSIGLFIREQIRKFKTVD